jgi:hypothetical protein
MGFEVVTAASMKMAVFWVTTLCILVDVSEVFTASIAQILEAASPSETSVNFCETARRYNP